MDAYSDISNMPPVGAIQADHLQLQHNNTYGILPNFYVDKPFVCRDCGAKEIWTAKQQKWWYEIAKGHIDSTAVRCRRCRDIIKKEKAKQKQHMEEMAKKKSHPNEVFFKNTKKDKSSRLQKALLRLSRPRKVLHLLRNTRYINALALSWQ